MLSMNRKNGPNWGFSNDPENSISALRESGDRGKFQGKINFYKTRNKFTEIIEIKAFKYRKQQLTIIWGKYSFQVWYK